MRILVDADALPTTIKELLFRTSARLRIPLVMVASKPMRIPESGLVTAETVAVSADSADDRIVELCEKGDLVITSDIPLADRVLSKGGHAIDPAGIEYTERNMKDRLSKRDLMHDLRKGGIVTTGPAPYDAGKKKIFANLLDRFLTKRHPG